MELMEVKEQVLRFSDKCREIDRQFELNNNHELDRGIKHDNLENE